MGEIFAVFDSYFKNNFTSDLKAGFITSVVALPLCIAIAMASGLDPIIGIYTAIIGGILASLMAGSKFSITGPTGAMAVIILMVVKNYGFSGLLVAGFLAGLIQLILGVIGFGKAVSYIPLPVISGFTAGIGVIIFLSQLPSALGLVIPTHEFIVDNMIEIGTHIFEVNFISVVLTGMTILLLIFLPRVIKNIKYLSNVPVSIFPLIISILLVYILSLSVPIVGEIPKGIPAISMPVITFDLVKAVLPSAFTIAMLGAIEALLCAVVCDGMSSTKHRPNKELISQGITNMVVPIFGGMPVTAAIARSAVNIREGAKTRFAGVIHALFILTYVLILNPLIAIIPKAFLGGILLVISAKMINVHEFKIIAKISKMDFLVLLTTFGLTIFTDLVFAVQVGMVMAIFLLFYRLTASLEIANKDDYKSSSWINEYIDANPFLKENVAVYTIRGPFFFGAMNVFEKKITEHNDFKKRVLILKMENVPFIDSTAVVRLREVVISRNKKNSHVLFVGVNDELKKEMLADEQLKHYIKSEYFFDKTKSSFKYVEDNFKEQNT